MRVSQFLSRSQVDFFETNGYLVLPALLGKNTCKELRDRASTLLSELSSQMDLAVFQSKDKGTFSNEYFLESGDKIRLFMEEAEASDQVKGHRVNKIGHALHDLDPVFSEFIHQTLFKQIAQDLGVSEPGLIQSMYIFKQPFIGGEVKVHQDATFLYTDPISVLGFWFSMQEANKENGCLWVLPGGHKRGLESRFIRKGYKIEVQTLSQDTYDMSEFVALEVPAGSLVLLHGLLPHFSEANLSSKAREAFAVHVIDQSAKYDYNNWLQRARTMPIKGFGSDYL